MTTLGIGLLLLAILCVLLVMGVWIALALGIVAWIGLYFFTNTPPAINLFTSLWSSSASWTLAALPLFVWMGEILFRTKLSEQMFAGLAPWLNWLPGRLMRVTILGCGVFGSVSGSSVATCATIAKVALPELKKRGYNEQLAPGALAGAGTLGILIPPSIIMVVYAVAADASIIRVFLAGFLPGLVVMLLMSGYIAVWAMRHPDATPEEHDNRPLVERVKALKELFPCLALIGLVCWVMVKGYATATEAAAFGVLGALAITWFGGTLTWATLRDSLMGATRLSCMILFILACASFLSVTMAFTKIPVALADYVASLQLSPWALIAILCVVYVILGTALDGVSMIVSTTTIVLPMVQAAGFDLVWFGIFIVLLVEIAEITPPVGFNLFVLQTMSGKDSFTVARAALPFFFMLLIAIAIITAFPAIVTWLPDVVMGKGK